MKNSPSFLIIITMVSLVLGFALPFALFADSNPLDFKSNQCVCSDLLDPNLNTLGEICMCESTPDWPGKVLVIFLTPDGEKKMNDKFYGLEGLTIE